MGQSHKNFGVDDDTIAVFYRLNLKVMNLSQVHYCDYAVFDIEQVKWNLSCPDCGDFLRVKNGKYGKFIACNAYPHCNYTKNLKDDLS